MSSIARRAALLAGGWALGVTVNRSLRRVRGHSMAPTLDPGDLLLTAPRLGVPRRGAVVVVRDPRDGQHAQVKRVLGLPGEHLRITKGRLLVDGVGLVEPYAQGQGPDGALRVAARHVAVLGDARARSTDSRVYGPVPLDHVDARVVARLLPRPRLLLRSGATRLAMTTPADGDAAAG